MAPNPNLKMIAVRKNGDVTLTYDGATPRTLTVCNSKLSDALLAAAEEGALEKKDTIQSPCVGCSELATACINCDPANR